VHTIVLKGNVVLPDRVLPQGFVRISGEKISGVFAEEDLFRDQGFECNDYGDAYIAPGLVDLHCHGALGRDVMDNQEESLRRIAEYQAKNGVTGFLAATMSSPLDTVLEIVRTVKLAAKDSKLSEILGVYLEGPFLSTQKKGAHQASFIKAMTEEDCERLAESVQGLKSVISLAPEVNNNMRFIPFLKNRGFVVALGHTNATYEQALAGIERGMTLATHLFNAMRSFHHREPGAPGAVLDAENIMAELIADGIHVHPAALRIAVARKGSERICLVTDSIMAAGMGEGIYRWGDEEIELKGSKATIRGSDVLAGSVLTLGQAVKNMIDWTGLAVHQVINMASLNPARVLGLEEELGSIQNGKLANLVVLDRNFQVLDTIWRGRSVLSRVS
jgi:N-acetylglucosamine-6-phosphate deacetylase